MKHTSIVLFLLFWAHFTHSQSHIYEHFGVDEGLPSSEVYDSYQDALGHIWFATDKGLSRYNGYEFENFTTQDGLPGNTVLDFYPQTNGQIWCYEYHTQSLFYFDDIFNGFKMYKYNTIMKAQLDADAVLKSVVVDEAGYLYIGGYKLVGMVTIAPDGTVKKSYSKDDFLNQPKEKIDFRLGYYKKKNVFLSAFHDYGLEDDIQMIDIANGTSNRMDLRVLDEDHIIFIDKKLGIQYKGNKTTYYKNDQNPISIKPIGEQLFFAGYYSGGGEIRDIHGKVYDTFLSEMSVSSFLLDREGGYWLSTLEDGVFHIKNPKIKVYTNDYIVSLVKDDKQHLFAGFNNGDIGKISKANTEILFQGLNTNEALVEFDNINKELYIYGDGYLINYSENSPSYNFWARKLPEQIAHPLLATTAYGFFKKDKDNSKQIFTNFKAQDVSMFRDTIFIGTTSGLYALKTDKILKHQPSNLLTSRIDDIDVSATNAYLATQGNGAVVYGDRIYNITKKDGLTNDIVSEVHIENDSTIWACTNTGLNRINFHSGGTYSVNTITKSDGLISNDINDVEIINDTVWVATKKGLCYFKKAVIQEKETANILSLTLKEMIVNNQKTLGEDLKLSYHKNNIDFKLQAITHKNSNNINYKYRLKEIDSNWTTSSNRLISFPSLSPGTYTFEARSQVLNHPNNLLVTKRFKILPPFWRSWWFYSLCFVIIASLVYLFFKIRVLSYNEDVFRELIRLAIKRLKRKEQFYTFRSNGEDFKITTKDILFVNSQGNYLDIVTKRKTYTIRCKIGDFLGTVPDALEFLRLHRSYIVRIDQVSSKGRNWVMIKEHKIPVGETYLNELDKIHF
ncbi:ligand-binding sensor domain-containing protein [Psychroserpens sp. BH13MA-6]